MSQWCLYWCGCSLNNQLSLSRHSKPCFVQTTEMLYYWPFYFLKAKPIHRRTHGFTSYLNPSFNSMGFFCVSVKNIWVSQEDVWQLLVCPLLFIKASMSGLVRTPPMILGSAHTFYPDPSAPIRHLLWSICVLRNVSNFLHEQLCFICEEWTIKHVFW